MASKRRDLPPSQRAGHRNGPQQNKSGDRRPPGSPSPTPSNRRIDPSHSLQPNPPPPAPNPQPHFLDLLGCFCEGLEAAADHFQSRTVTDGAGDVCIVRMDYVPRRMSRLGEGVDRVLFDLSSSRYPGIREQIKAARTIWANIKMLSEVKTNCLNPHQMSEMRRALLQLVALAQGPRSEKGAVLRAWNHNALEAVRAISLAMDADGSPQQRLLLELHTPGNRTALLPAEQVLFGLLHPVTRAGMILNNKITAMHFYVSKLTEELS